MKNFVHRSIRRVVGIVWIGLVLSGFNLVKAQEEHISTDTTKVETAHAEGHNAESEGKFDPNKLIFEHVGDSHQWHMWGEHEHAVAIPLPIILYIKGQGLETFMSSVFHHGTEDYKGKYNTYRLVEDRIKIVTAEGNVDEAATDSVFDFSITKNVASMLVSVLIIMLIFTSMARAYKKNNNGTPRGLQSFMEPLVIYIRDEVAIPNIGEKHYQRFMPFLLTVFFFIWINNLLGMLPNGANLTGNIAVTMVLAIITFILTSVNAKKDYWKHIVAPNVPFWLWPIMFVVEVIGVFSKPFALMIRLFANITAGHIIVISLISLIFIFKSLAIAPVSVAFVLFIDVLELLVSILQAFIFTMLSALFIGSAMVEHHHEEHAAEAHH